MALASAGTADQFRDIGYMPPPAPAKPVSNLAPAMVVTAGGTGTGKMLPRSNPPVSVGTDAAGGQQMSSVEQHLSEAIRLARDNARQGGRPFGALIVKDGAVIATGVNETVVTHDPTAHAELLAIRAASEALGTPHLQGCTVYASGHPCPMCLAAMHMSGIGEAFYAYSNEDGAPYGLTSAAVYAEFANPAKARSVSMTYRRVRPAGEPDLYEMWQAATRG